MQSLLPERVLLKSSDAQSVTLKTETVTKFRLLRKLLCEGVHSAGDLKTQTEVALPSYVNFE